MIAGGVETWDRFDGAADRRPDGAPAGTAVGVPGSRAVVTVSGYRQRNACITVRQTLGEDERQVVTSHTQACDDRPVEPASLAVRWRVLVSRGGGGVHRRCRCRLPAQRPAWSKPLFSLLPLFLIVNLSGVGGVAGHAAARQPDRRPARSSPACLTAVSWGGGYYVGLDDYAGAGRLPFVGPVGLADGLGFHPHGRPDGGPRPDALPDRTPARTSLADRSPRSRSWRSRSARCQTATAPGPMSNFGTIDQPGRAAPTDFGPDPGARVPRATSLAPPSHHASSSPTCWLRFRRSRRRRAPADEVVPVGRDAVAAIAASRLDRHVAVPSPTQAGSSR